MVKTAGLGQEYFIYIIMVEEETGKIIAYSFYEGRYKGLTSGDIYKFYSDKTIRQKIKEYTDNPTEGIGILLRLNIVLTYEKGSFVLRDAFREKICPDFNTVIEEYAGWWANDIVAAVRERRPFVDFEGREWRYKGLMRNGDKLIELFEKETSPGCEVLWGKYRNSFLSGLD